MTAEILDLISKIAPFKTTVLITGETGTGKELVAREIHEKSPRRSKRFVAINCSAIPEQLLESELFGHARGSFTGAVSEKSGLFEEASGGTLFLDEVGDLPLSMQTKLLRVLQEREIRRVGSTKNIRIDVRIIAATLKDLSGETRAGRFREDLFYRLNVFPIHLRPLNERKKDIQALTYAFIEDLNVEMGKYVSECSAAVMHALFAHDWPGNIRELRNVIERMMVLEESKCLSIKNFPTDLGSRNQSKRVLEEIPIMDLKKIANSMERTIVERERSSKKEFIELIESQMIKDSLQECSGNRSHTAKKLGINIRTLLNKIRKYDL